MFQICHMLINVKVFPCSKEEKIIKKSEHSFEIKVKERPVMGQAKRNKVFEINI